MTRFEKLIRNLPVMLLLMLSASFARADLAAVGTALDAGDDALAEQLLGELGDEADQPQAQLLRGRLLLQRNELDESYEVLSTVAEALPDDAEAQYWHGAAAGSLAANVSMLRAGRYAGVTRKAFTRAIELDPQHVEAHQGLISFHLQAPRIVGGKKKEALRLAEALRDFAPLEGAIRLAEVHRQLKQPEDARKVLKELTEALPDEPSAWSQLGFQAQADEDWAAAHAAFTKGAQVGDDSQAHEHARFAALYQVGRTAVFANDRQDEGIAALERYLTATLPDTLPGKDWANFRVGLLYEQTGERETAKEYFLTAKSLTDDDNLLEQLARKL